ncbi:MAG: RloB domain-containing protein [Candidatus Hydrogenedentes bacterium]|nr:RloB domain-containing protein [Candidatus Hydrogenedentota bacterium]
MRKRVPAVRRRRGARRYLRRVILAVEGSRTEPAYFGLLDSLSVTVKIRCLKSHDKSAPLHVLKRLKSWIQNEDLALSDAAWLVVDRDTWSEFDLEQLHAWSCGDDRFGLALSNPCFEYWLLLHFEDGTAIKNPMECRRRLRIHIPDYSKHLEVKYFDRIRVAEAIRRAELRDSPPCTDWPRKPGGTTVCRLVKRILEAP